MGDMCACVVRGRFGPRGVRTGPACSSLSVCDRRRKTNPTIKNTKDTKDTKDGKDRKESDAVRGRFGPRGVRTGPACSS